MNESVIARVETMTIPTYPEAPCEELPMFAENRVHQRSSGNPYPNKVVIKTREKQRIDRDWKVIRLENEFLELIIIPSLGGRIFAAKDKRNGYDFFYRQHVIKPALIGALGSWISGGIEFNWPYHHRPSTFLPVDYEIVRDPDGAVTVWLSEHEPIDRMKGMVGIRLEPGKCRFETRMKVANRTPLRRSFLWWENTAVPVNPEYEIFFPADVDHVNFHYRRSATHYPIARGHYNGYTFPESGTDISRHFNTKFPTSYFSAASEYDYFGGYDCGKNCGVVHIGDCHTAVGKKMFTWAYNQLSRSWERALTDTDGAYAELMAGSYSNNQPDFSWLEPYETKNFSQFWYPIADTGIPSFANLDAAVSVKSGEVRIQATTAIEKQPLKLTSGGKVILERDVTLAAGETLTLPCGAFDEASWEIALGDVLYYEMFQREEKPLPDLFPEVPMPNELPTAEKRYLGGLHFMQFRDPNADPAAYFKAALALEPDYIPALTVLGELALRNGDFIEAEAYLEKAIDARNVYCTEQESGKIYYLLGLAREKLGKTKEAYAAYRKAAWSEDSISAAMTRASLCASKMKKYREAAFCAEAALAKNGENVLALPMLAMAKRALGEDVSALIGRALAVDPLNHAARLAAHLAGMLSAEEFFAKMHSSPSQTCLDVAFDYLDAGYSDEAMGMLRKMPDHCTDAAHGGIAPTLAYFIGRPELASEKHRTFPFRPEEEAILKQNADIPYARYLLGCLKYHRRHYGEAGAYFKTADGYEAVRAQAVVAWKLEEKPEAIALLREAAAMAPDCEQIVWELALCLNRSGADASATADEIASHVPDLAAARDDIVTEWAAACIRAGRFDDALYLINNHTFIPCEGGETIVAKQHLGAWYGKGRALYEAGKYEEALAALKTAQVIPENLGAGLWHVDPLVPSQYL
ncbi:MAG: DUF5107 domain-containing protein, partial [Clostridia bacterium]|nr:DUF5107 domain-containing protein [Clostridia bacterium]